MWTKCRVGAGINRSNEVATLDTSVHRWGEGGVFKHWDDFPRGGDFDADGKEQDIITGLFISYQAVRYDFCVCSTYVRTYIHVLSGAREYYNKAVHVASKCSWGGEEPGGSELVVLVGKRWLFILVRAVVSWIPRAHTNATIN